MGEDNHTFWCSPGAVVEEGEIQVVVNTAVRSEDSHLWSGPIVGFRGTGGQCQDMAPLQALWQARARTCDDAVCGSGSDRQGLDAAVLSYVKDESLARQYVVIQ